MGPASRAGTARPSSRPSRRVANGTARRSPLPRCTSVSSSPWAGGRVLRGSGRPAPTPGGRASISLPARGEQAKHPIAPPIGRPPSGGSGARAGHDLRDDPVVLPDRADALEPVLLEHRDGRVEEKRGGDLAVLDAFGEALHEAAAEAADQLQGPSESGGCHPSPAVRPVYEEARDPPVRGVEQALEVHALVLDARELLRGSELAPADTGGVVVDERRVRATLAHAALLLGAVLRRRLGATDALGMEAHAPAAAPHAVVPLDELRKVRPGGPDERSNRETAHGRRLRTRRSARDRRRALAHRVPPTRNLARATSVGAAG